MKILHVHYRYDQYGGGERYLHALCRAQQAAGHDIVVLTSAQWHGVSLNGEKVYGIQPSIGLRSGTRSKPRVIELLKEEAPDIVHLHHVFSAVHGFISPLVVKAIQKQKPTVHTVHDAGLVCFHNGKEALKMYNSDVCRFAMGAGCSLRGCFDFMKEGPRKMLYAHWAMDTAKKLDKVLVSSDYMKVELLRNGFLEQRIAVLPLFSDHKPMAANSESDNTPGDPL